MSTRPTPGMQRGRPDIPVISRIRRHVRCEAGQPFALGWEEVMALLEVLGGMPDRTHGGWIRTAAAQELTGEHPRTLRDKANRWRRRQERGEWPDIRVTRTGAGRNAHWEYAGTTASATGCGRGSTPRWRQRRSKECLNPTIRSDE
jgi:hypothetical protein